MRSLAEYEGGNYLPSGWHETTVTDFEFVVGTSKGTDGVQFTLTDANERVVSTTFWLTERSLFRLAGFAAACGLSEEQRRSYDVDKTDSHQILVNKRVQVEVYKRDGKYSDVNDWAPIGASVTDTPADPRVDRSLQEKRAEANETQQTGRSGVPF